MFIVELIILYAVVCASILLTQGTRKVDVYKRQKQGLVKGQRNAFKKAIVTLKNGDAIDFYSNIK